MIAYRKYICEPLSIRVCVWGGVVTPPPPALDFSSKICPNLPKLWLKICPNFLKFAQMCPEFGKIVPSNLKPTLPSKKLATPLPSMACV